MLTDATESTAWEYTIVHTDRLSAPGGPELAYIWRRKYSDGSTDWDQINNLGADGWEMVNAFPVESGGSLQYLAFVFKRPKRAGTTPAPRDPNSPENAALDTTTPDQPARDQASPSGPEVPNN